MDKEPNMLKMLDELNGTNMEARAKEPFSHMVVDKNVNIKLGKVTYGGNAYAIGTKRECQEWQLANGKRATTEVIPF